jgi:hypothetical protein
MRQQRRHVGTAGCTSQSMAPGSAMPHVTPRSTASTRLVQSPLLRYLSPAEPYVRRDNFSGRPMEIGVYTFAETTPDPVTGTTIETGQRLRDLLEEIELADQVGLEVFGIGEHHRLDFSASAPAMILAAGAERSKNIKLTTAVTVLSSDDPVRVYQQFATLDLLSGGRAEIMAGRGSFIESFPLFGYDLNDYDDLFAEKFDLLLKIRDSERVTWSGVHRAPLNDQPGLPAHAA